MRSKELKLSKRINIKSHSEFLFIFKALILKKSFIEQKYFLLLTVLINEFTGLFLKMSSEFKYPPKLK
jgi:hypothetical protein